MQYEKENEHLRNVLSARGLSRVCIRAEQLVACGRSSFIKAAGKRLELFLAYPAERLKEAILVGSSAEGLKLDMYKAPKTSGDADVLFLDQQFKIVDAENRALYRPLKVPHVLMEEDKKHPGYVKLKVPQHLTGHEYYKGFTETFKNEVFLTGKKNTTRCIEFLSIFTENIKIHGPAVTCCLDNSSTEKLLRVWVKDYIEDADHRKMSLVSTEKNYSNDLVFCHYYDGWPQQAENWVVRKSRSHWPRKDLKVYCVEHGCILAAVGPKLMDSPEKDTFWRISFNQAEQILIESFNETQLHCLVMLKFMKMEAMGKISGKNITSYVLKTTMFWCMEEVNQTEWRPDNLIQCVVVCLKLLRKWVADRFMPNYFIQTRNMFVHSELTESIANQLVLVLDTIIADPWQVIRKITPLEDFFKWEDKDLVLRAVKVDIRQCISFRTNITIGRLLCGRTHKTEDTATKEILTAPGAPPIEEYIASRQEAEHCELLKHVIAMMYNVQSTAFYGQLPIDCLGIIAGLVHEVLDIGPYLILNYWVLIDAVWKEHRLDNLDKYRKILSDDLVEGDLQRTIEVLRGDKEDAGLGRILAEYLDQLNACNIISQQQGRLHVHSNFVKDAHFYRN